MNKSLDIILKCLAKQVNLAQVWCSFSNWMKVLSWWKYVWLNRRYSLLTID